MPPWLAIALIAILIAAPSGLLPSDGRKWFRRLQRPQWLTFEQLIPLIWTVVFVCGAWSAYIVWNRDPGSAATWGRMVGYMVLEAITIAYSPAMLWTQKLRVGIVIGAAGVVVGGLLTLSVLPASGWAALLLVPYLIWSPIGTYVTQAMVRLNPQAA